MNGSDYNIELVRTKEELNRINYEIRSIKIQLSELTESLRMLNFKKQDLENKIKEYRSFYDNNEDYIN